MNRTPLQSNPEDVSQPPTLRPQPSTPVPTLRLRATSTSLTQHSPRHRSCCAHRLQPTEPPATETPAEGPQSPGLRPQLPNPTPKLPRQPSSFVPQPPGLRPSVELLGSAETAQHTGFSRQCQCCVPLPSARPVVRRQTSLQSRSSTRSPQAQRQEPSGFIRPSLGPRREVVVPDESESEPESDEGEAFQGPGLRPRALERRA